MGHWNNILFVCCLVLCSIAATSKFYFESTLINLYEDIVEFEYYLENGWTTFPREELDEWIDEFMDYWNVSRYFAPTREQSQSWSIHVREMFEKKYEDALYTGDYVMIQDKIGRGRTNYNKSVSVSTISTFLYGSNINYDKKYGVTPMHKEYFWYYTGYIYEPKVFVVNREYAYYRIFKNMEHGEALHEMEKLGVKNQVFLHEAGVIKISFNKRVADCAMFMVSCRMNFHSMEYFDFHSKKAKPINIATLNITSNSSNLVACYHSMYQFEGEIMDYKSKDEEGYTMVSMPEELWLMEGTKALSGMYCIIMKTGVQLMYIKKSDDTPPRFRALQSDPCVEALNKTTQLSDYTLHTEPQPQPLGLSQFEYNQSVSNDNLHYINETFTLFGIDS